MSKKETQNKEQAVTTYEQYMRRQCEVNEFAFEKELRQIRKEAKDLLEELDGTKARQEAEIRAFCRGINALTRFITRELR